VKAERRLTIGRMVELGGVSRAGFYRFDPDRPTRPDTDMDLRDAIQRIALEWPSYGRPRITAELKRQGWKVNPKRVGRLLREDKLLCVRKRKFVVTTDSQHAYQVYPNLACDMVLTGINQLWVADITYIRTAGGFLYLAVVLDVWSRRIVGWAMTTRVTTRLVLAALDMAIRQRQPRAVIHHSDQGCQYTAIEFGQRCRTAGVRPSMGTVGDCYDNAMCESFFATLECELLDRQHFQTPLEARRAIFDFIEGFYNTQRRHSALGYRSPLAFERRHAVDADGAVDAENASTTSLENAQNAFSTAPTAIVPASHEGT